MNVPSYLGIGCFYCPQRITVSFREMANNERARVALKGHGWMLAVNPDGGGGVLMDPVCHDCGLGVMREIIERGGGRVDPAAAKSIRELFPELADKLSTDTD